jgi:hypothetical protein
MLVARTSYEHNPMATVKVVPPEAHSVGKQTRPQSGTAYPYFDLEQSIKVAEVIYKNGGGHCTPAQLAAWLDYKSTGSGTYNMRFYAAKHFGLIDSARGVISTTQRGKDILAPVMPEDAVKAKVEAFMSIPLFASVHDKFKGQTLPPEMGMKNLLQNTYKIVPERVTQALRVLMNSAEQAGFFSISQDRSRMIPPAFAAKAAERQEQPNAEPKVERQTAYGGGGGDGTRGVHEALSGLLRYLPPPGTPWSTQKRETFLKAFTAAIDLIYPEESAP